MRERQEDAMHLYFSIESDGLWHKMSGAVPVPAASWTLQLRPCVIGHTGAAVHRRHCATLKVLRRQFWWNIMEAYANPFVGACVYFLFMTGGTRIPRHCSPLVHQTAPNELLRVDFLQLRLSIVGDA